MPSALPLPFLMTAEAADAAPPRNPPVLAFGPFRLLPAPPLLCRGEEEVRLGRRALDLLQALVARPGQVLSRHELEAHVWPSSIVEDSSLRVHIAAVRRALGDGVDGARYIANVPGRGYSFVAGVREELAATAPDAPAPAGQCTRVNNLPTSLNRLIGRESVIALLAGELQRRRLASIVGHGGIGKTALALAVAARAEAAYADGVCFVDLAPLTEARHVGEAVATALGLMLPGERVLEELERWLRPRRLLLVLDNCEHLLDAVAALLERVLRRAPGLDVLATSREPIDAEGEWVHRLLPLEAPPDGPALDGDGVLAFSAMQLLAERAAASLDTFVIDAHNMHLAAALCRRLDGVPLAIEFAASRIGLLGLQGVCVQLDDRLRLLGSGRRTALPRHRTLRALLDWSYQLLSPVQQQVLRRCGVFRSAFSLEAACAVVADAELPAAQVRDCLFDLVAKSLVRAELAQGPPLYSLLEITRAYALDHLAADPQRQAVYLHHARYVLDIANRGLSQWEHGQPGHWFNSVTLHLGNMRAAMDWSFGDDGVAQIGIELLAAVARPMAHLFSGDEFRQRIAQARKAIDAGTPVTPLQEMRILSFKRQSTPPDAGGEGATIAGRELALASATTARAERLEAHYHLFTSRFGAGDYPAAAQFAQCSEQLAKEGGVGIEIAHAQRLALLAAHYMGDHGRAVSLAGALALRDEDEALPIRLTSWLPRAVSVRIVLARVLWMQGRGGEAMAMAARAVSAAEPVQFAAALSQAICLAGLPVAIWMGDDGRAQALLDQLAAHVARFHEPYWGSWMAHLRRVLALRAAPASLAASLFEATDAKQLDHLASLGAWACHRPALARLVAGQVGWNAPELWRVQGDMRLAAGGEAAHGEAEQAYLRALAVAQAQRAWGWSLRAATGLARLYLQQGRGAQAQALLAGALARCDGLGADAAAARALLGAHDSQDFTLVRPGAAL